MVIPLPTAQGALQSMVAQRMYSEAQVVELVKQVLECAAREVYEAYSPSTSGEVKFAASAAANRIRALIPR